VKTYDFNLSGYDNIRFDKHNSNNILVSRDGYNHINNLFVIKNNLN